ncbi:WhiB family transcriptional regulator [Streptomyces sp. ISL-11]|uniref:WhiB family transcriptional regulator n=1 Tax=Streptomyces sp. ISL-11 TaxID=2819174 RepID=UPI001BE7D453|nr:WhiB family transcriptional regulator [Streptomyces sp. ISL-11]MBT2382065.1 WhiB family transcriptional regulator [Streptomyces sp. ISL-11]
MNWRQHAACREEHPDLFFPIGTGAPALTQTEDAKSVCRRCPVMERCLRWALETNQEYGVWGGTSEAERRALRRTRQRTPSRSRHAVSATRS